MAFLFDLTKPHLAYYSVPAAFMLVLAPHSYAMVASGKNYDIAQPRTAAENCKNDTTFDKRAALRIQRAEAATANGFETLGMYSAGIVAAAVTGVPATTLNYLSLAYLASRVGFNTIYVWLQDNKKLAPLRSVCWNISAGIIVAIWVKAGNRAGS
ncbi:hypothetical protein KVR01_004376 [Diaporthe batatas]|uniref:uncharacterized protein n=1 Tax=Diaporthe batatas TaxID=748121 RepID=UPI001D045BC7|nr:uncharacterized protein KVR01_004376 [Diaporthe batatas]KAG8165824.1 hypothetical protein KVR01_004376 [Diaporthe batatas]